jgi:hypothetical protein
MGTGVLRGDLAGVVDGELDGLSNGSRCIVHRDSPAASSAGSLAGVASG